MTMTPGLRKFVRTAHVTFTVGWLGAVAGFLALALAGLASRDAQMVSVAYPAMDLITRFVIVPLSLAPLLLTGPILSLGTSWGLFRHYWILVKLLINILSTVILLVHMQPISYLARVAAEGTLSSTDRGLQIQLVVAAGAGLLALLVATALAVYKPRGMTPYGWGKQYEERTVSPDVDAWTQASIFAIPRRYRAFGNGLNIPVIFTGTTLSRKHIVKTRDELVNVWNAEYPADMVE